MNFNQITNRHFLRNSYSNSTIAEANFLRFLDELKIYLKALKNIQLEENGKVILRNLLNSTGFQNYKIETYKNIDLVIYQVSENSEQQNITIETIIETKKPNNSEMITDDNFLKKSFAQIYYYFFVEFGSSSLKHLILIKYLLKKGLKSCHININLFLNHFNIQKRIIKLSLIFYFQVQKAILIFY